MKNSQGKPKSKKDKEKVATANLPDDPDAYPAMTQRQKRVVKVLSSQQAARNQMDIEYLGEYFNEFDFLKKEKVSAEEK